MADNNGHNPEADRPASAEKHAALTGLLSALGRAVAASRLYDSGHALVRGQIDDAAGLLPEAARQTDEANEVMLGVGTTCFYADEEELLAPVELSEFAALLHQLDIALLRISIDAEAAALSSAVGVWAEASRHQSQDAAELSQRVSRSSGGAVRCVPLDYEHLETTEESRRRDDGDRPRWSWARLIDQLLHAAATDPREAAEATAQAAQWVAREVQRDADGGMRLLHDRMHEATAGLAKLSAAKRGEALHRLNGFLNELTPELRSHLLHAAGPVPDVDVPETGSTPQVLRALSSLDGQLNQAARQSLMMCEKLAVLAGRYEEHKASDAAGPVAEDDTVVATLEELLSLHDPEEHTPRDYLRRLEQISAGDITVQRQPARAFAEAFRSEDVRRHAAKIAVHLAGAYLDEDASCAEPMRYLTRRADDLVRHGSTETVAAAARAAEDRLGRGGNDETLSEARALLERIRSQVAEPETFKRLMSGGADAADLATLLRLSDPGLLASALDELADATDIQRGGALAEAVRGVGAAALNPALEQLAASEPARLLDLLPRLAPLPFPAVSRWLGVALTQGDPDQRLAAFRVLRDTCPSWPAESIQTMLNHPEEPVRSLALNRLMSQRDRDSLELMGVFLSGRVTGRIPPVEIADRVTNALLDAGDEGVEVLGEVLTALGGVFHPKRSQRAARIAERLSADDAGFAAQRTVQRWSRTASALWCRSRVNRGKAA